MNAAACGQRKPYTVSDLPSVIDLCRATGSHGIVAMLTEVNADCESLAAQLAAAQERCGLLKLEIEHKGRLLESCETALSARESELAAAQDRLREIEAQEPIAWRWLLSDGLPDSDRCFDGAGPDADIERRALTRELPRTVQKLYTRPVATAAQQPAAQVADLLLTFADAVEWEAFKIPAPNAATPIFVGMCQEARRKLRAAQQEGQRHD